MVGSQSNSNPARIPALGFRALALIVLSILLILIILLQPGKGADVGAAFGGGGGGSAMFGPRGPANLLSRATTVAFVLFLFTSITLALYSNKRLLANVNGSTPMLDRRS